MGKPLRVLIIDDSEDDSALLLRHLRESGYDLTHERVETAGAMNAALAGRTWDLIISDHSMARFSASEVLALLKQNGHDIPVIIVSTACGEECALETMKAGAQDCVDKPDLARLVPAIERELHDAEERRQRRQAEEALAWEQDFSRMLVDAANALVVGLDAEGRITVFNRTAEEITGYRRKDLQGRNWFEVLVPRDRYPEVWKEFLDLTRNGISDDFENPILTASGEERIITWRNSILRDGDAIIGTISFGIDVTEQRRAEEHVRRAEKMAALGTLAAGLAHEINNPMGIILSRIELMLMEAEARPAELRGDLQVIHRNARRVAEIAQRLLSFARPSRKEHVAVDLNEIVEETLLLAGKQMAKEGIQVTRKLDREIPQIQGDANSLQQALLNLLTNARDAIDGGGEIRIETSAPPERPGAVQLSVADTGCGIQPEEISKIFDLFYTTKRQGTGLGLSVTYGIVRDHGGSIDLQSTPSQGTRFVLTFPAQDVKRPLPSRL